ncbi:hypothetical protein M422DRAFT_272780 [Sphaerobolus stellatus SS14]|uniref:Uncharacterized protein n=1 Tax=Sphaerobolus stellatus (strain SS14) TaxID=990650 RepID=A0A0C9ULK2_SPHS4|nr:hypothetical protein M422DRAFT_272780 [Sphaerobolus stellatus SS14]
MSVLNALREDVAGYFLGEDVDVVAWLNKVIGNLPRQAIMNSMKAVFGSRICQGTPLDFRPEYFRPELPLVSSTLWERFRAGFILSTFVDSCGRRVGGLVGDSGRLQTRWITDASTPLRIDSQITKGIKGKSQIEAVKIPNGSDFLKLILDHCSLSKEQVYNKIIPYMIRDEEKRPLSAATVECAAYMALRNKEFAHYKGKRPITGPDQSKTSAHAQGLDTDLADYNNQH